MRNKHIKIRENFINLIQRYNTFNILRHINFISSKIYNNKDTDYPDVLCFTISYRRASKNYFITPWELIDLAYYTIKYSDSNQNYKPINNNDFLQLYSSYRNYNAKVNYNHKYKYNIAPVFFLMASEQIKYQNKEKCIDNYNRELYILNEILPNIGNKINIDCIIKKLFNVTHAFISKYLFLFFCFSLTDNKLNERINQVIDLYKEDKSKVYNVINYYSSSFEDIKSSTTKKQIFYTKPFVKGLNGDYLSISCYLNLFTFEHSTYWIVRNYYKDLNSNNFTNDFGICFELYFEELLNEYVEAQNFHKIKENNKSKSADWYVKLNDFEMIIEQKASLAPLDVKNQNPDLDSIEKYINTNINEAATQLDKTHSESKYNKAYKIILFYDDYVISQIDKYLLDSNNRDCCIININEMETILYTYKHNRNIFDVFIEEFSKHFKEQNNDDYIISTLIRKYELINKHIKADKYSKYFIQNIKFYLDD